MFHTYAMIMIFPNTVPQYPKILQIYPFKRYPFNSSEQSYSCI